MTDPRQAAIDQATAERQKLKNGECPRCQGAVSATRDQRQTGPSCVVGVWWKYRCDACGYICDLLHPDNN
jgi:C4-type Zn-finger protein